MYHQLYVHNMGHATCAYLGDLLVLEYIYQAIAVPEICVIVQNAMLESALALHKKYGAPLADLQLHITDLLGLFTNAALGDTCQRVGGDPVRKLGADDRLIGSSRLVLEAGITPAYITLGAAVGISRFLAGSENKSLDPKMVLQNTCSLHCCDPLSQMILDFYYCIEAGNTIAQLLRKADAIKTESLDHVI